MVDGSPAKTSTADENNSSFFKWFRKSQHKEMNKNKSSTIINEDTINNRFEIPENLPYFMKDGLVQPLADTFPRKTKLFPEESPQSDRIIGRFSFQSLLHNNNIFNSCYL